MNNHMVYSIADMLATDKVYSSLEEEVNECIKDARKRVGSSIEELPSYLKDSPLDVRNNCIPEQQVIRIEKLEEKSDKFFMDSVKQNVSSAKEPIPVQISTLLRNLEDDVLPPNTIDTSSLDSTFSKQRQEFLIRIFSLLEIYNSSENKLENFWNNRNSFIKDLLRWIHPLVLYMDSNTMHNSSQYLEEFILLLSKIYSNSKRLKPVFRAICKEFEIDIPQILKKEKQIQKKTIPTKPNPIETKKTNIPTKKRPRNVLTSSMLRNTSGSFYYSSNIMKQCVTKRRKRRDIQPDEEIKPPPLKRKRI